MSPRFHLDEHFSPIVATALRRHGIDVTTSQEAGLLSAPDERQLARATADGRVMVTCDDDFLILHARGLAHHVIVYWSGRNNDIGGLLHWLTLVSEAYDADELAGNVEYLP